MELCDDAHSLPAVDGWPLCYCSQRPNGGVWRNLRTNGDWQHSIDLIIRRVLLYITFPCAEFLLGNNSNLPRIVNFLLSLKN
ncbi:hypothetical protein J6590_068003 [Homalodisca vitripennis]|nr:hypothetical protein J6590_068003 [Homalodisca vitripennis]